ncbi:MAG: hypothetical protein GXO75_07850 [Calditrichaeota bacterium]|nr:hypothetical protein [Calditrichota bacterium]
MKQSVFVISIFFMLITQSLVAGGLKFHGSAKNSIYSFESNEMHTKIYQYARFNVATANNRINLNASMRALTDANQSLKSDQRFKMYSLRLQFKNLLKNRLNFSLGRQFLHPGTVLGALDGVNGNLSISKHFSLQFYSGVESNFQKSFKVYEMKDSFVNGGVFQIGRMFSSKVQFLYLRKENENNVFWHLTGANFYSSLLPKTRLRVQAHYDLENQRMHRLLISVRNPWSKKFLTTVEFKSQYPQVYANSYFTIFEPRAYTQYRVGAAWQLFSGYYLDGQFQFVNFEKDSANRFFLTLQSGNGSVGFVYESGYAGDQLGLMFDYAWEFMENFVASVYMDYSKYRIEEVYEYENQLANAARLSYRLNRHFAVDVEYQWLTNRFKKQDSRFLNHISYLW